ncbi:3-isopropylmalate dehydratase large subunit [Salipiger sp. P9]|uniref:3-isopropylmalate dehydratase large subunit n=1 Tax=Salipiger pentaromativorans TaxID=2943193 RepID=UPI0021572A57|nr:3-isopropylmalate dehydratase large subunit [Salipiger pentaromativorans]MCR8551106.1 3-isopropylmalate dehydratase large subunit [Salipiger pentaromativorans]
MAETMYDKIWNAHAIVERDDGQTLLYVPRHIVQEGSRFAFEFLQDRGLTVRRPRQMLASPQMSISTRRRDIEEITNPDQRLTVELLIENTRKFGVTHYGLDDPRQGIVHVVAPELGFVQPGTVLIIGDSHTCTAGAMGTLAIGVGATDVLHVLATQSIWQRKMRSLRITVDGILPEGVTAKDVILTIVGRIGANGGKGHVFEYAGSAIRAMSVEERLTVCNMSIEAGARSGMIAPDDTTFDYLAGRQFAPRGASWDRALRYWRSLPSDEAARFDREIHIDAATLAPMVTWGTSPEDVVPVDGRIPDPRAEPDAERRAHMEKTLGYMGLAPGTPVTDIAVDQVFIGSCTNARIEDLRAASAMIRGRRAVVPAFVVPGSTQVKHMAEAEGLDVIFRKAGFGWGEASCSMCVGMNGDTVGAGKRCVATISRSAAGRQGRGSRTHLVSPAAAAAAALTGRITDIRKMGA